MLETSTYDVEPHLATLLDMYRPGSTDASSLARYLWEALDWPYRPDIPEGSTAERYLCEVAVSLTPRHRMRLSLSERKEVARRVVPRNGGDCLSILLALGWAQDTVKAGSVKEVASACRMILEQKTEEAVERILKNCRDADRVELLG